MDLDILADINDDGQPAFSDNLLSHLPDRTLAHDEPNAHSRVPGSSLGTVNNGQVGAVVSKIECIFERVADCILDEEKVVTIKLKVRRKPSATAQDTATGTTKSMVDDDMRTIKFPSKSPKEALKFAALLRILELSHEALVAGVVITKRDMFYRDPELFVKQAVVDRYVDDLAYSLGVERDALNVVAAAKGLVAGSLKLTRNNSSVIDYSVEADGMLIPSTKDVQSLRFLGVEWILVIEKEATFRALATNTYWESSLAGKGIMVTAKGYPDIQTRQFLHLLSAHTPLIPIFALVDFDPDGLGIMSTYKYGSVALAHENANLAVPSIRWLGVRINDIVQDASDKTGLLKLSNRDRRIATRMLEKEILEEEGTEPEWRRELQVMLLLNVKAEIQILSSAEGLEAWLDEKLLAATS